MVLNMPHRKLKLKSMPEKRKETLFLKRTKKESRTSKIEQEGVLVFEYMNWSVIIEQKITQFGFYHFRPLLFHPFLAHVECSLFFLNPSFPLEPFNDFELRTNFNLPLWLDPYIIIEIAISRIWLISEYHHAWLLSSILTYWICLLFYKTSATYSLGLYLGLVQNGLVLRKHFIFPP